MIKLQAYDGKNLLPFKLGPEGECKCSYCGAPGFGASISTNQNGVADGNCGVALLPNWTFKVTAAGAALYLCPECSRKLDGYDFKVVNVQ